MVRGLAVFKQWFADFENQYVIIGGTACDILMEQVSVDFRATKDIDLVLIIEALTPEFGARFWEYIKNAGYEHCNKSSGNVQFYRFQRPKDYRYPFMIELFSRKPDALLLPNDAILTPLSIGDEISSLSAILLDDTYYNFLRQGAINIDGISVLDTGYIIPFKAKAWLDLNERKTKGEPVDSKDIRKHKNDILRLFDILPVGMKIALPQVIFDDMRRFIAEAKNESLNLKQLGIVGRSQEEIFKELEATYVLQ